MSMERYEKREKLNIYQWVLLITINSFIPALIWDIYLLIYLPLFFLSIFIPWTIIRYFKKSDKIKLNSKDISKLMIKYLKINRKYIFASIIGIILSVTIFSSAHLVSESYRQLLIQDMNLDESPSISVTRYGMSSHQEYNQWTSKADADLPSIFNEYGYNVIKTEHHKIFSGAIPVSSDEMYSYDDESTIPHNSLYTLEYSKDLYGKFSPLKWFSTTYDPDDSILIGPSYLSDNILNLDNGKYQISILLGNAEIVNDTEEFNYHTYPHMNYTFDNYFLFTESGYVESYFYEYYYVMRYRTALLLQNEEKNNELIDQYLENTNGTYINNFYKAVTAISNYYIDMSGIDFDLDEMQQINRVGDDIETWGRSSFGTYYEQRGSYGYERDYVSIIPILGYTLSENFNNIGLLQSLLLAGNSIILILTLFLVYFSMSMLIKRKERMISIMKVRGTDEKQVKYMLMFEFLMSTTLAIVIGMLFSLPWARITLNTSGYFQFSNNDLSVAYSLDWLYRVPLIGLIIAFNISFSSINDLGKTGIDEGEIAMETKEPLWKRKNIDLVLFVVASIYWLAMLVIDLGENDFLYEIFWSMIGFFVFLILVISAPLVTARFFSDFIMFLSKIVWRKRDSISYLSIHNMRKYRISISKLVSLLMIGSMLSIMAITIPPTFEAHNTESAIYSVGAEMRIDANISDPAVISLLQDNRVIAFTEIVYGVISVIDTPSYEDIGRYNIMGINPNTFVKAAYWQDDYDDTTLADIVNSIDDGNNDSIALESVYHEKMTTGGEFVNLSLSSALTDFQFRVKSSYDMFPNLVMRKPRFDPWMNSYYLHQTSILTRIDIAKRLLNMDIPEIHSTYHTGFYLDLVDGIDIDEFKSEIEQVVGEGTVSMPEMEEGGVPLIFNNVLFSLFHALIITFLIVSFTAFSYYSYISMIERKKEIGIYRALGMVHKQIFKIYLIENIIIFLSGIVIGSITGLLLNEIVFMIYKGMEGNASVTIPPIRRVIPYDIIAIFYGLIILINLIPVILPPKILSRQQVGDILRLD